MMITGEFVQQMARYNRWQNSQLKGFLSKLTQDQLDRQNGAFFGSLMGTANHLLWGDWIWMSRFDKGEGPGGGIPDSTTLCGHLTDWIALRDTIDDRISNWADTLGNQPLTGQFTWFSAAKETDVTKPYAQCVIHMFNHQTHHRGQIHHMLTACGSAAPVSDLVFLPGEV